MAQWVHLYETSDEALDLVLRTFGSVFSSVSIWQSRPLDFILIGSARRPPIDFQAMQARLTEVKVARDLQRIEIARLPVLLAREIVSEENGRFLPRAPGPLHTDLNPVLEYVAQRAFFVHGRAQRWRSFDENYSPRATTLLAQYLRSNPLAVDDFRALARVHFAQGLPPADLMRSLLLRWQRDLAVSSELLEFSAQLANAGPAYELEALRMAPLRETIFQRAGQKPELLRQYARLLLMTYRSQRSIFYTPPSHELRSALERLLQTDPGSAPASQLQLAELAWDLGDDEACVRLSQEALAGNTSAGKFRENFPESSEALFRLLEALQRTGRKNEARELCRRMEEMGAADPRLELACRKLRHAQPRLPP